MNKTILIIFVLISSNVFGQTFLNKVKLTKDSDTTFWYNYHLKDIKKLKLIKPDSDVNFLRVSSSKYYLELSPKSNKIYFYVTEISGNVQTGKSFIKSFELTGKQVGKIENLYKSLQIQKIPSDKFIKNWEQGFDGITYIIESKNGKSYSFKTYWTPSAQNKFDESKRILEFTTKLDKIIDYSAKRKEVEKEIPFNSWSYKGSMMVTTKPTSFEDNYEE